MNTAKTVKSLGLRLKVVGFRHSLSSDLEHESSTPVVLLNELRSELELIEEGLDDTEQFIPQENTT